MSLLSVKCATWRPFLLRFTAAETGHLVLATLHTPDAPQTIERIIDVFPSHQQQQVKLQLADCLAGSSFAALAAARFRQGQGTGNGNNDRYTGIRNLIREQEIEQIPTLMQTGCNMV